jgi:hypothetical protein
MGQQQHAQKRKEMKAMAKRRNDDDPQPMCPPSMTHHAQRTPKHHVPSIPFKKGSTVDTTLLPGLDRS